MLLVIIYLKRLSLAMTNKLIIMTLLRWNLYIILGTVRSQKAFNRINVVFGLLVR
jgi:hypothetical protein